MAATASNCPAATRFGKREAKRPSFISEVQLQRVHRMQPQQDEEQHDSTGEKSEREPFTPQKTEHQCHRDEERNERFHELKQPRQSQRAAFTKSSRE